mgnify:CR=1 FL=1
MKLSETKFQHLVVTTPIMQEVVGYAFVINLIAAGHDITEVRLLTEEAVEENLQEASQALKSGALNLKDGPAILPVLPGKNDGELVEIDITQEEAQELLASDKVYKVPAIGH